MDNVEIPNPLYGVTIGTRVSAFTGQFTASVVNADANISIMKPQDDSCKYMTGESSFVYSENMNQGSLGMSGAYGVSGVSLVKSSLSAYVGNSSAASIKDVSVDYNAISISGVEYINFEALTAADFIASLNQACQQHILLALSAYKAVMAAASESGLDLSRIFSKNDAQASSLKKLIREWVEASEQFTHDFGDGLVVGVIWGALGRVSMVITSKDEARSWKYGGQADFSYANIVTSAAVGAIYDGGQSGSKASVKVNCTHHCSGSVLKSQVDEWFNKVENTAFKELVDINPFSKAPDINFRSSPPQIPDFVQPYPDSTIVDNVNEIENLEELDKMATAAAYDKAKKDNNQLGFDEFVNNAGKPANKEKLEELNRKIVNNEIDTLKNLSKNEKDKPGKIENPKEKPEKIENEYKNLAMNPGDSFSASSARPLITPNTAANTDGYVPLGVWISNWTDLFPWLAQGYYNSIDSIGGEDIVAARVMLQDYQTLCRMYCIAHSSGIVEFKRKDSSKLAITSLSIADAFFLAADQVKQFLGKKSGGKPLDEVYEGLGDTAQNIYQLWNKIAFLRSCELGLGLMKDGKTIGFSTPSANKNDESNRKVYPLIACDFTGKNFTVFSHAYKVLPLLTPDGDIWAFGPEPGALSSFYDNEIIFSKPGRAKYLVFNYNKDDRILSSKDNRIKLYPIPFSAANTASGWKGMSFSTNIGSDNSLKQRLKLLSGQLDKLNAWTFSSASWDKNWNGKKAYSQEGIKKQYMGIVEERGNIFQKDK